MNSHRWQTAFDDRLVYHMLHTTFR